MSDSQRPPRNSSPVLPTTGGPMATSVGRRRNSSNTPSGSANNENGQSKLDKRFRSVLCHPLGLPLVSAFHGEDPQKLPHLGQVSEYFNSSGKDNDRYDDVLKSAVEEWRTGDRNETKLTTKLNDIINSNNEIPLKVEGETGLRGAKMKGRVDLTLFHKSDVDATRPLMFVEVGRDGADWWKKFDQGVKYVDIKYETGQQQPFMEPLLLAIMTVEDDTQRSRGHAELGVKLAVFLCTKRKEDNKKENVRISLMWHSRTSQLKDASDAFGRLLRRVCDFSSWIPKLEKEMKSLKYEYFSSNCCRVDDEHVLRSYDSRFRPTTRSPVIYLNKACRAIVGGEAEEILNIKGNLVSPSDSKDDDDDLWTPGNSLRVIRTPYRPGFHVATKPTSFLPIIDDLVKLHDMGFVHGDIRGFNTVFDENGRGCLIDFDLGGEHGNAQYPPGYRVDLRDGKRIDVQDPRIIEKWHDWYALGRLIFEIHDVVPPKGTRDVEMELELVDLKRVWSWQPTIGMIAGLKDFLTRIDEAGWTVQPNLTFEDELKRIFGLEKAGMEGTNPRATGSPPKKV